MEFDTIDLSLYILLQCLTLWSKVYERDTTSRRSLRRWRSSACPKC